MTLTETKNIEHEPNQHVIPTKNHPKKKKTTWSLDTSGKGTYNTLHFRTQRKGGIVIQKRARQVEIILTTSKLIKASWDHTLDLTSHKMQ